MLLNVSPLPANTPVMPVNDAPPASGDGFMTVMARQFDGTRTTSVETTAAPAGDGAVAALADPEDSGDQDDALFGSGGMEILIGEMVQRPEVAGADGSSLPLVDALEALADLLAGVADELAVVEATDQESVTESGPGVLAPDLKSLLDRISGQLESLIKPLATPGLAVISGQSAGDAPALETLRELTGALQQLKTLPLPAEAVVDQADLAPELRNSAMVIPTDPVEVAAVTEQLKGLRLMVDQALGSVSGEAAEHLQGVASTHPGAVNPLITGEQAMSAAVTTANPLPSPTDQSLAAVPQLVMSDNAPDLAQAVTRSIERVMREAFAGAAPEVQNPVQPAAVALPVLDAGFALESDPQLLKDLTINNLAALEGAKVTVGQDPRLTVTEAMPLQNAATDKSPHVVEQRPVVVTGRADVWLQQPEALPEHVLEHVNRLHAQSLRLHAAGFTDLVQRLTLSMYPEELGQVDVQLRTGEQMNLTFIAREAGTRDLLEQNLPRLRQLFESQGLNLGDVNVGSGQAQARQESGEGRDDSGSARGQSTDRDAAVSGAADRRTMGRATDRLIDIRA